MFAGIRWFIEGLFPPRCIISSKEGSFLAPEYQKFPPPPENKACFQYVDQIYAATSYHHPVVEKVVVSFKFQGLKDLAPIMALSMNNLKIHKSANTIIPIPLHWTRLFWRGFNQAQVLAQAIQKENPEWKINLDLRRPKRTRQQAKLGKEDRFKNLKGAFQWCGKALPPEKILLIDDVVATGSTIDEAARVLKIAGAKEVIALVFARGGGQ